MPPMIGILIFDLATGAKTDSVPGTRAAYGLALSPDGAQFYVTFLELGTFAVVDRASKTVVKTLGGAIGAAPVRVRFNASGTRAVVSDKGRA